jgi:hypothetical protein
VRTASIIRAITAVIAFMMGAVRTSETSTYFHKTTRRYIPEVCHLHTHRRENLKPKIPDKFVNNSAFAVNAKIVVPNIRLPLMQFTEN